MIIYSLSGIVQTYRDSDFLKHEVLTEKQPGPGLNEEQLGGKLRLRDFKVIKTTGTILFFKEGFYDAATGKASYVTKEWYSWILPFTELHKTAGKNMAHYFTTIFGILLLFMSVSAFWMFKPGTKAFSSGLLLTVAGITGALLLLFFQ